MTNLLTRHQELMLDVGQTGVVFNDTSTARTGFGAGADTGEPRIITAELHPETSGSERLQYVAALQQMLYDVSAVAVPPAAYTRSCNGPYPELDSTVKYLEAALVGLAS